MSRDDELRRARNAVQRMLLRIEVAQSLVAGDVQRTHGEGAAELVRQRIAELLGDLRQEQAIHDRAIAAAGA